MRPGAADLAVPGPAPQRGLSFRVRMGLRPPIDTKVMAVVTAAKAEVQVSGFPLARE